MAKPAKPVRSSAKPEASKPTAATMPPLKATGASAAPAAGAAGGGEAAGGKVPAEVAVRPRRYLIAPRALPGNFQPMSVGSLHDTLEQMGVRILKRLRPRGFGLMSAAGGSGEIIVTEMPLEEGARLQAQAPPHVIVEHDAPLVHHGSPFFRLQLSQPEFGTPPPAAGAATRVRVRVQGKDGKPIAGAKVTIYGQGFPAEADTDVKGEAEIAVAGPLETVRGIYVKPLADFWERVQPRPHLVSGEANVIILTSFAESFPDFPRKNMMGWGQRIMGLDRIDPRFDGAGVRIGIMDSGCDNRHPQLRHVVKGEDLVAGDGGTGWTDDTMAHGTHCAGIIGARSDGVGGIRGFAPGAEIHAIKVFPSGRISDLIDALDIAMERQLDVMNMSLGSADPSELVQQKVVAAVNSGVACIVAAGNSSGPVQFPGMLPQSITISAVGQAGQFPDDTNHAMTVGGPVTNGIFPAKFSCFGPEVRLSAPGVAIVSTVPGGGYAAWDGTSMATPHVTGLAALVLAHHPALKGAKRDASRVAALFHILQASAVRVVADPLRDGSGLPHAPTALAAAAAAVPASPPPQPPAAPPAPSGGSSAGAAPTPAPLPPPTTAPSAPAALPPQPNPLAQLVMRAELGDRNALIALARMGDPAAQQRLLRGW